MISVAIGLYVRKFIKNMRDFVTAGRNLGLWLGIATMTGTELGLITVMYSAQKGFTGGFATFHIALAALIVTFVVGMTGFIVYRLREMKVMTIPEFYEKRFDRKTRILGGIMMVLGGILNMGLFLKVGSMFLVGITGLSATSWALPAVMIFLVAGGGFGWDYIAWMFFLGLVSCAIWPTAVARALSMENAQVVKRQYMFTSVSYLIRFLIPYFWGISAFVFISRDATFSNLFFPAGYPPPETMPAGVEAVNNLYGMPFFLGKILPAGFIGLVTAGMLAAFMSTHDSYLLCWSTSLTQDVVAPIARSAGRPLSSKKKITLTRVFIVMIGGFVLYWGLFYKGSEDIWDYMAVTGAIYFTGAFALLLGGLYWKRASSTGAFVALIGGLGAIVGLTPVQDLLGIEYSSARVGLLSIIGTIVLMIIGSLLFPDRKHQKEPKTIEHHVH
jgi:SSS family solute:Na+ symporter